ncbi:MAG: LexA repressor [Candidatus Cloacimonetes bacterium ADurb.Bin088]|jgi:SOS-response transcriptional repressor LexA|nr:MAG: LexA repressor [Candidatus Cloacimonetes bacterium ADurb.Bin088]
MLGYRLKALRKHLKLSQAEIGGVLNVNASAISQMESNRIRPSLDTLGALAREYGVNLHWLITGDGNMFTADGEENTERRLQKIRTFINQELLSLVRTKSESEAMKAYEMHVGGEIAAGPPVESAGPTMDVVTVNRAMLGGKIEDFYVLRVNGRSMEPQIYHNDLVIIRKSHDWNRHKGSICAVRIDGEITLKRLTMDDKSKMIVLLSVNEEYSPILVNPREHQDISLIGNLKMILRKL